MLDTGHGGIIASETLVMSRGHAEAIMPLIARVMDLADAEFADLDRIAITTDPAASPGYASAFPRHGGSLWRRESLPSASPRSPALPPR